MTSRGGSHGVDDLSDLATRYRLAWQSASVLFAMISCPSGAFLPPSSFLRRRHSFPSLTSQPPPPIVLPPDRHFPRLLLGRLAPEFRKHQDQGVSS